MSDARLAVGGDSLRFAGVAVELGRGVTHDFIKLGRVLPEAKSAQALIGKTLRQALFS